MVQRLSRRLSLVQLFEGRQQLRQQQQQQRQPPMLPTGCSCRTTAAAPRLPALDAVQARPTPHRAMMWSSGTVEQWSGGSWRLIPLWRGMAEGDYMYMNEWSGDGSPWGRQGQSREYEDRAPCKHEVGELGMGGGGVVEDLGCEVYVLCRYGSMGGSKNG
jgi:hypothetical protein